MSRRADESEDATALLPAGLLAPGEYVRWMDRPSRWYILWTGFWVYIFSFMLVALMIWALTKGYPTLPPWTGMLLGIARLTASVLMWLSRVYIVTDRQAVMIAGVFTTVTVRLPLDRVQHTRVNRRIYEQLTGIGTLEVATAGSGGSEIVWEMVNAPYRVQEVLEQARESTRAASKRSESDHTVDETV